MVAEPEYAKELVINQLPDGKAVGEALRGAAWTPDDPRYNEQWHYHNTGQQNGTPDADIDLPEAWEITKGNPEVIVAVIDQGIQTNHPDLIANMWEGIGYNFINNSPNIVPGDHGSHVAGTVAGVNNNGIGISGVAGGSGPGDGVRLMSCQVFNPTSGGGGFQNAPVWAADNGAAISQNSWGYTSPGYYEQAVLDAIDYFNINGGGEAMVDGGITIFAAGNSGSQGQWYPGYYSGCFSVAATNNQDKRSWYSNYDTWVDVSAPGGETNQVTQRGVLSCWRHSNYGFYEGTSMACPHVSGIAALMISLAYGQFTPAQVADIIRNTTDDHYGVNPGYIGKLGTGRVNAHSALLETLNQMILVNNPLAFSALPASNTQINLNWVKNPENDAVMIAWNTTEVFGDPVQSQAYQTGDLIQGGGTVLYLGAENSFQHTGLNSNTPYYYKVWSVNGVNEYSTGISANATTLKDPIVNFPYHQDFDEEAFPPASWENKKLAGAGDGLWDRQQNGTDPVCEPQSGDAMARFNSNEYMAGTSGLLVTPPVMFGSDNYEISFWMFRDSEEPATADKVEVYANISPNAGFATLMGTVHRSVALSPETTESGWQRYVFELPAAYYNKLTYIILKGMSEQGNSIYIDEFHIEVPVSCFPPENLTATAVTSASALIGWTAVEPATAWDMEIGMQGFEPGTGTLLTGIADTALTLEGLEANTAYDIYVRGACDDENSSIWTGPLGFTTLCYAETPWEETFEGMNDAFECWQVMSNTAEDGGLDGNNLVPVTEGSWLVCTPESFGGAGAEYIFNGERSAAIDGSATGFNWLITGEMQMPEAGNTDLAFMLFYANSEAAVNRFYVNILDEGNWRPALVMDSPETAGNHYRQQVLINMDGYQGKRIRLAFVYEGNDAATLAVDNIGIVPADNYWTGKSGSAWTNEANWRLAVPEQTGTAQILPAPNQPVISGSLEMAGIQVHPGASLTLAPDAQLTVTNSLINMAGASGLILKAGEQGHATLIHPENDLSATVEVYTGATGWQLLSMPFDVDFEPEFSAPGDGLLKWHEASGSWIASRLEDETWNPAFEAQMIRGHAYLSGYETTQVRSGSGLLDGTSFSRELQNSGNGWHLSGNPFTASISYNPSDPQFAAIGKVWNAAEGSFTELYPEAIIPAFSGFAVEVLQETATHHIPAGSRTHEAAFLPEAPEPSIELSVSETLLGTRQRTAINLNQAATEYFDVQLDAGFLPGFAPQFYSLSGGRKFSVNTLPSIATGAVIPLGFVKNEADNYVFEAKFDALYPDMVLYLNDLKTGELHLLNGNSVVEFAAEAGDAPNRFELIFGTLGIVGQVPASDLNVYAYGSVIYMTGNGPIAGKVTVSSLQGSVLLEKSVKGETVIKLDAGTLANGIYIVSLTNEHGRISRKVVISR
jgi:subtilisin family serine protease